MQVFYAGFAVIMGTSTRNTKLTVGALSLMVYTSISAQFQPDWGGRQHNTQPILAGVASGVVRSRAS